MYYAFFHQLDFNIQTGFLPRPLFFYKLALCTVKNLLSSIFGSKGFLIVGTPFRKIK